MRSYEAHLPPGADRRSRMYCASREERSRGHGVCTEDRIPVDARASVVSFGKLSGARIVGLLTVVPGACQGRENPAR